MSRMARSGYYELRNGISWNFKHIVDFDRIRLYHAVNLKHGYRMLEVSSPRDLTS